LEDNSKKLEEYNIKENDFLVLFVTKAKTAAQEKKAEEPKPVESPLVAVSSTIAPVT